MSLWLVRHARPLVASGICYGTLDLPADAAHTQATAQALAEALPSGCKVQVSPLLRCLQLAQALLALRPDLPCTADARLREMDFGSWEGVAWDAVPRAALDAWTQDFANHRFGGKESAGEVLARVAQAWDALPAAALEATPVVWISHAGVARALCLLQQGVRQLHNAQEWPKLELGYGQWLRFAPAANYDGRR